VTRNHGRRRSSGCATTVMLSFISFWKAAAIVLSTWPRRPYYVGGIAEHAVGKAAPWFILSIHCCSPTPCAPSTSKACSMFVRGGVYKGCMRPLGGTLAKFSVSALMFDYAHRAHQRVSAGLYLGGLINETGSNFHIAGMHVNAAVFRRAHSRRL